MAPADPRGLHLHLDMPSGIAGDMTLGALFDLGVPEAAVRDELGKLGLGGFELRVARGARRGGMAGTDVKVVVAEGHDHAHHDHGLDHDPGHHHHGPEEHAHRHYADIRALVERTLAGRVRELALAIFDRVARAEARLHGVPVADVAFHEVGAVDSIVDIVGTAAAVAWLAPASVSGSPVAMGHGTVRTAHGILPVPSPAALEILREAGAPTVDGGLDQELCTPTGAAIAAELVGRFGPAPPMIVRAVGYGAGDLDFPDRPNLLRVTAGELTLAPAAAELYRVEANLDDMSPELCEHVAERLFAAGALDVWWTPVVMKKSRPAFVLGVLAGAPARDAVVDVILAETTTLGVRWDAVERRVLDRRSETVDTPWGPVSVKLGAVGGRVVNVAPEYESCRALALAAGVPLKDVYAAALSAWRGAQRR